MPKTLVWRNNFSMSWSWFISHTCPTADPTSFVWSSSSKCFLEYLMHTNKYLTHASSYVYMSPMCTSFLLLTTATGMWRLSVHNTFLKGSLTSVSSRLYRISLFCIHNAGSVFLFFIFPMDSKSFENKGMLELLFYFHMILWSLVCIKDVMRVY